MDSLAIREQKNKGKIIKDEINNIKLCEILVLRLRQSLKNY
jgi:hypothetical protein